MAAGVTLVFALFQFASTRSAADMAVSVIAVAVIAAAGWAARELGGGHRVGWAVCPLLGTVLIVLVDLLTADGTLTAQVFLFFPALYGASQLRRRGAVIVTSTVLAAEWAIVLAMLPLQVAVVQGTYMTAALVTTAALLTLAGERQDRLVTLLERQAAIDPLTGLVTRRVLDEAAVSALSGAAGHGGTGLVLIDVDDFKGINDAYGHPGGDEVLIMLAQVLIRSARPTDTVSRLGGDEIALLLPGCSAATLVERGKQILTAIREADFLLGDGRRVKVSISGGLAHAPTNAASLHLLYVAADTALYRAKQLGRNQICLSTSADPSGDHRRSGESRNATVPR
ncbi:GGDEF domain-containing protein [Nakamurella sp. GG22]